MPHLDYLPLATIYDRTSNELVYQVLNLSNVLLQLQKFQQQGNYHPKIFFKNLP